MNKIFNGINWIINNPKKVICMLIGLVIITILWNTHNPRTIIIKPFVGLESPIQSERVIEVTRTAKCSDGVSVISMGMGMGAALNSQVELINTYNELATQCESISSKNEKLVIPKGAGSIEFGDISAYAWHKEGKNLLGAGFVEKKIVIIFGKSYIMCNLGGSMIDFSAGVTIEAGEIK